MREGDRKGKKVSSGELESFLYHFIKFIIVSSAECNVAWCFWHKMYMYQRRIWNEKRDLRIFFLFPFFLATEHRRILIRFLSILQSYHLNFTLEKYSEHVIFSIIFLNVPCAYLLYFLPHHHHHHRSRRRRRRLSRPFEAKASEMKKGQGREGIWIE